MARATAPDTALASQPGSRFSRARYRWRSTEPTPATASKERSPSGGLAGGHFSMVARVSSTVVWTRITRGLGALSRAHVTTGPSTPSLSVQDLVDPAVGSHGGRVAAGRDSEQRHMPDGLALDTFGQGL